MISEVWLLQQLIVKISSMMLHINKLSFTFAKLICTVGRAYYDNDEMMSIILARCQYN